MQSKAENAQMEKNLYEMIAALRDKITLLKDQIKEYQKDTSAQCGTSSLASPSVNRETSIEPAQSYKWWIRDIIATVPVFDGYNIDISHFISACRDVQKLITTQDEDIVLKLLLNKLTGDANGRYKNGITTITGLIDVLKSIFGNGQTLLDYYEDLKDLQQEQGEDILSYTKRTETLYEDIIEAEIQEKGSITDITTSEINDKVSIAFRKGLPWKIQISLKCSNCSSLLELCIEAIKATREHEKRMRRRKGTCTPFVIEMQRDM